MFNRLKTALRLASLMALLASPACDKREDAGDKPEVPPETDVVKVTAKDAHCADLSIEQLAIKRVEDLYATVDAAYGEKAITRSNEIHDCQGLIATGQPTPIGALIAFDNIETDGFQTLKPVIGVTLIGGDYNGNSRLRLKEGRNCIWMKGVDNAADSEWQAYLVPLPDDVTRCSTLDPTKPDTQGEMPLRLYRSPLSNGHAGKGYPEGVRWEEANGVYYIGVKCLSEWCVLGVPGTGSPPAGFDHHNNAWGDRQSLAVLDSAGKWQRSRLKATIKPEADIGTKYDTPDKYATERHVATIKVTGNDDNARQKYAKKWELGVSHLPNEVKVFVLYDTATKKWWMRFGEENGTNPHISAEFADGDMGTAMGTTRFRWSSDDEGVWVQCATGCCGDECTGPQCTKKRETRVFNRAKVTAHHNRPENGQRVDRALRVAVQ